MCIKLDFFEMFVICILIYTLLSLLDTFIVSFAEKLFVAWIKLIYNLSLHVSLKLKIEVYFFYRKVSGIIEKLRQQTNNLIIIGINSVIICAYTKRFYLNQVHSLVFCRK